MTETKILVEIDQELQPVVLGYLEGCHRNCIEIKKLLASGCMEDIRFLGHQLKGSGGSFGFDEISDIGEVLECAVQILDADRIREAVNRLEVYLKLISVEYI